MRSRLNSGFCAILLCLLNVQMNEGRVLDHGEPPVGRYNLRFWANAEDVQKKDGRSTIFQLEKVGYDIYKGTPPNVSFSTHWYMLTGRWISFDDSFSGFYSSSSKALTGAWFSNDGKSWGSINYYWNGVSFAGRCTTGGSKTVGYEIMYPVDFGRAVST